MKDIRIGILLFLCCFAAAGLHAQNDPLGGRDTLVLENERIEDVIESTKPFFNPPAQDVQQLQVDELDYQSRQFYLETAYQPPTPQARTVELDDEESVRRGMIKAGIGRFLTPLFQLYLANGPQENVDYGLDFTHHSAHRDPVTYRRFRRDYGSLSGMLLRGDNRIRGKLHIFNTSYFNYADTLPRNSEEELENDIRMGFTRLDLDLGVDNAANATTDFQYDLGLRLWGYRGRRDNSEFHLTFTPDGRYQFGGGFSAALDAEITLTQASIAGNSQTRSFLALAPIFRYRNDRLQVEAGLRWNRYNNNADTMSFSSLVPLVDLRYQLLSDMLVLAAGYTGGMQYNHYYGMMAENPYLAREVMFRPTVERMHVYAGIQGKFNQFDYSGRVFYKRIKDQLVYTVPFDGAYFQPAYDSLMTVYGLHLEGQWSPGKHFHAGAAVTYNMYETSTLPEYFHATPLRADVFGTYIWNERLTARAELNFYSNTPTALDSRGEVLKRSSFLNVGLGGEYRIIDGLSVYVSLNNLLGTEFTRWHNYPERPLDISGGVSYTF